MLRNRPLFDKILTLHAQYGQRRFLARAIRSTEDIQAHRGVIRSQTQLRKIQMESNIAEPIDHTNSDYLGINEVNDFAIVHGEYGYQQKEVQTDQLKQKYQPLLDLKKHSSTGKVKDTWFGRVRLDSDNVPKYHGQFEKRPDSEGEFVKVAKIVERLSQHQITLRSDEDKLKIFDSNHKEKRQALPLVDEDIDVVQSKTIPRSLTSGKIKFRYASEFANQIKPVWWDSKEIKKSKNMPKVAKDW